MSRSMMPTASRSCVGTICTAASGKPCFAKARVRHAWIAALERALSEPPRKITALPLFKHSAAASAVTFGRLS